MLKKLILIHLMLNFFFISNLFSLENKILLKIENQIITSVDVNNEYKYLIALNPSLKNSKKEEIIQFSKKSIIQEKIKKSKLKKILLNQKYQKNF